MSAEQPKPRVFMSYSSPNKEFALRLAGALQVAGASVWFDAWEIRPGDSIPAAINRGLSKIDIIVVIWSSGAAKSKWVESEAGAAMAKMMQDSTCRVICATWNMGNTFDRAHG